MLLLVYDIVNFDSYHDTDDFLRAPALPPPTSSQHKFCKFNCVNLWFLIFD